MPDIEHKDEWNAAFLAWYDSIPHGVIVAPIASPGNGALFGWKSSAQARYGAFIWIGDGVKRFLYIDISHGNVTTNWE